MQPSGTRIWGRTVVVGSTHESIRCSVATAVRLLSCRPRIPVFQALVGGVPWRNRPKFEPAFRLESGSRGIPALVHVISTVYVRVGQVWPQIWCPHRTL